MLQITIPSRELWDSEKEEFIQTKDQILCLEHSLVSVSKWEERWCKSFFSKKEKTYEEIIDYIKCMTITQNVDPDVYKCLTDRNFYVINKYIEAPMTATRFAKSKTRGNNRETLTAEIIYYQMIYFNIPFECRKWHLNKLLTLIRVCIVKNTPPQKMSDGEIMRRNAALNSARRKRFNTRG